MKGIKAFVEIYRVEGDKPVLVRRFESKSFLGNFAKLLYGYLGNVDAPGMKDFGALSFNVRTTGDANAGPAIVVLGTGTTAVTPDDYAITGMVELDMVRQAVALTTYGDMIFLGIRRAQATETWSECGLYQNVFDTGGVTRKVLLARDLISPAITLNAGDLYIVCYRIMMAV